MNLTDYFRLLKVRLQLPASLLRGLASLASCLPARTGFGSMFLDKIWFADTIFIFILVPVSIGGECNSSMHPVTKFDP